MPTQNLRDNEWPNEFKKWGCEDILEQNVRIECVQSVYKDPPLADMLIADEIHKALSPQYSNVFTADYDFVLGLTATLPTAEDKMALIDRWAPIVYKVTLNQAVEQKLITNFEVLNLAVSLSKKERYLYNKFDGEFREASGVINTYNRIHNTGLNVFDAAQKYKDDDFHEMYRWAKQFWFAMTRRKQIAQNAESKVGIAIKLIEKFPDKKWIIFSKSIKLTKKVYDSLKELGIAAAIYHSQLNKTDRQKELDFAKQAECRVICSAEALNTGFDLPTLDAAICLSSDSSSITAVQQIGRTARLGGNSSLSLFINLFALNTREEVWIQNKYSVLDQSNHTSMPAQLYLQYGN